MLNPPASLSLPLQMDAQGNIRVSGTRVTLHTLLSAYHSGDSPERIHEGFPTVPLADIHAVISYYLTHQAEVDAYIQQVNAQGERIRQQWEERHPPPTKADLLARKQQNKGG